MTGDQIANFGTTIKFHCNVTGLDQGKSYDRVTLKWFHMLRKGDQRKQVYESHATKDYSSVLTVTVEQNTTGIYICEASVSWDYFEKHYRNASLSGNVSAIVFFNSI